MSGIMLAMAALAGGGAVGVLDAQVVKAGGYTTSVDHASIVTQYYGYQSGSFGAISDGTSDIYAGAAITALFSTETLTIAGDDDIVTTLEITGTLANSGWTSIHIGSSTLNRADAAFSQSGGMTRWQWAGGGFFSSTTTVTFS